MGGPNWTNGAPRWPLDEHVRASALLHLRIMAAHDRLTLRTATRHLDLRQAAILGELLCARGPE